MTERNYYDKKIVYLDYLEHEVKIKNAGYVKWEVKAQDCRIQIHIRGLYTTDTLQGEIILLTNKTTYKADMIQLQYGAGEYIGKWDSKNMAGTGISYEECRGILIILSESRKLKAIWGEVEEFGATSNINVAESQKEDSESPNLLKEVTIESMREKNETKETIVPVKLDVSERPEMTGRPEMNERPEETGRPEMTGSPEETEISEVTEKLEGIAKQVELPEQKKIPEQRDCKAKPERFSADKWVQLNRIYPHIRPFGDKREYLSVAPRDFVVLTRRYQNLVQNSFLLHGYYNYGHVILTKIREGEDDIFYLGVPGVYYEREKQAAIMFGFEGFESGTEVAGEGGFGYYMKRVDI